MKEKVARKRSILAELMQTGRLRVGSVRSNLSRILQGTSTYNLFSPNDAARLLPLHCLARHEAYRGRNVHSQEQGRTLR
eukprot:445558-Pleurochrysis_carterae.AAC.1